MGEIEECKTVQIWVKKACGTETTKKGYLWKLNEFFKSCDENPDEVIQRWRGVRYDWTERQRFLDEWSEKIEDYYALLENTPLGKISMIVPVKSFFSHNKIPIEVETQKHPHVKYHNRDIQKSELRRILDHSRIREKTAFLMIAEGGFRPKTLVQLKYRDIREDFEANKIPMKVELRPEIVKDAVQERFTFIGQDAFNALKEYLSIRNIDDDHYIFAKERKRYNTEYLCPEAFSTHFARIVKKLKLRDIETEYGKPKRIRLYCLRKYFRNNMKISDTNFREFWMCHRFDSDEHYISLDVERHREEYSKGYSNLRVYEATEKESSDEVKQLRQQLDKLQRYVLTLAKVKNVKHMSEYELTNEEYETMKREILSL